jgi:hypothetical protein
VPSEPHPQSPYAEPLTVQTGTGLVVAVAVEKTTALPPPAAAATAREERMTTETSAAQAGSEAQARTVPGDDDNVVMSFAGQGAPPPLQAKEDEAAVPEAPEAVATPPSGSAGDMPMSRYVSILDIGIVDSEIPST